MTTLREAAQQALEAWDNDENGTMDQPMSGAMETLRAALKQPEQEPVAWIEHGLVEAPDGLVWEKGSVGYYTPLYTHPPRRTGLPHCERSCEATAFKIEIRRLKAEKQEIGAALRRLISYCHTLENRFMEADGEHPALQQAKEAYAKVET